MQCPVRALKSRVQVLGCEDLIARRREDELGSGEDFLLEKAGFEQGFEA